MSDESNLEQRVGQVGLLTTMGFVLALVTFVISLVTLVVVLGHV